ncbi:MAG: tetratricopeptide repeat protein [Sphingopyxis sp.]
MVSAPSIRKQRREAARAAAKVSARERRGGKLPPIVLIGGAIMAFVLLVSAIYAVRAWMVDPLARGRASFAAGNYRAARVDLTVAASEKPNDVAIRIELARAYNALGRGAEAERQLDKAAELGADLPRLAVDRAQAQLAQGDAAKALATLAGPLPRNQGARALRIAAQANYRLGNVAATRANFAEALRLAPNVGDLWIAYARFRLAEQDLADADNAADRAWALSPQSAAALALKADIVRTRGGPVVSIPWYQAALSRDPDNVPFLLEYAAALGESGRYGAMLEPLRRAADLEPRNTRALFLQAVLAARGGEPALARTLLSRVGGGDGELPGVLQLRAAVELSLGTPVAAGNYAARLVELQPDNSAARRLLALALAAGQNPRGAIDAIDAITIQPDADSWSLLLLARSFAAIDWQVDAAQPLERASRLSRGSAGALRTHVTGSDSLNPSLAVPAIRARLSAGSFAQAKQLAAALAQANPGVSQAWLLLGDTELASGDTANAIAHFRRAADLRFDEAVALRLVHAHSQAGVRAEAGQILANYMARWPENIAAMRIAAAFRAEDGDWAGAHHALMAISDRIGSNDVLLLAQLARCELELGNVGAALPLVARAYRLLPGNATISGIYGIAMARSGGSMVDARDLLDKAVQLAPEDMLLRQWRAEVMEMASSTAN